MYRESIRRAVPRDRLVDLGHYCENMKIILHIGTHKTGTTALQDFFARNRQWLLEQGILYPSQYVRTQAHHPLPWALGVRNPERDVSIQAGQIAQAVMREMEAAKVETILLSSEEFRSIPDRMLGQLAGLFPGATFQIVVYLRRQDEALASEYGQHVRMHSIRFSGTIYDFYLKTSPRRYDYLVLLNRWEKTFSQNAITVRVYDRKKFSNGDIIADFLQTIGVTAQTSEVGAQAGINRNLPPLALEILRRANRHPLNEQLHHELMRLLENVFATSDDNYDLISRRNRREIILMFKDSNAGVAKKWLGRDDGALFDLHGLDDEPPPPYEEPDPRVVADALLGCLIESIRLPR
jgi:hypothetical protein